MCWLPSADIPKHCFQLQSSFTMEPFSRQTGMNIEQCASRA